MPRTSTARELLILDIESKYCPNSTDGGGKPANHYVKDGGCVICDRSVSALTHLHGIPA